MTSSSAAVRRSSYVSYLDTLENLRLLVAAAAGDTNEVWTVCETAGPGDTVVFYYTEPIGAFIAHGRVIRRSEQTWGDTGKPMAEVGMVRLFPEPVSLKKAKARLGLPWLNAASGFGRRAQEDVHLILALGRAE